MRTPGLSQDLARSLDHRDGARFTTYGRLRTSEADRHTVPSTGGDIIMRDTTLPYAALPPVTCTSWCTDGQGQQDQLLPAAQYCSDDVRVEVSGMPMVESATGPDRSHLLVGLTTSGPGTPARVTLNTDNLHQRHDINLTFLEATHLAFSVLALTGTPSGREEAQVLTSYQALDPERQQRLAREAMRLMSEQTAQRRTV